MNSTDLKTAARQLRSANNQTWRDVVIDASNLLLQQSSFNEQIARDNADLKLQCITKDQQIADLIKTNLELTRQNDDFQTQLKIQQAYLDGIAARK